MCLKTNDEWIFLESKMCLCQFFFRAVDLKNFAEKVLIFKEYFPYVMTQLKKATDDWK